MVGKCVTGVVNPAEEDMEDFIWDYVRCYRAILSRVMDGRQDRMMCEDGEVQCGLCEDRVGATFRAALPLPNNTTPNNTTAISTQLSPT